MNSLTADWQRHNAIVIGYPANKGPRYVSGTYVACVTAATGRGPGRLPGPGRGRVPRLRFHLRGGQTARLRYQHRAPLARPSRGDGARSRPLDPQEGRAPGERGSVIRVGSVRVRVRGRG